MSRTSANPHPETARPDFPPGAFAGTAAYYVRYRIPYPERLLSDLVRRSGARAEGRLLDLACGPGRVALDLARSFREVSAVDLEPEMVEAGKREAARRGLANIAWSTGRAEDFESAAGRFSLISIGDAFHRLDQGLVARRALHWLEPGGCLAILGSFSVFSEREPWHRTVVGVARRWSPRLPKAGAGSDPRAPADSPDHHERVLREAGFLGVTTHSLIEPHEWTTDSIVGFLYSTSVCSKAVLGADADAFEAELRSALRALDPAGTYRENIEWGYTLATRPGRARPGSARA